MSAARINIAHLGAEAVSTIPAADDVTDGLAYSADLVARVHAEAADAVRLPWWFWEAGVAVVAGTILLSAVWPMGVNP